MQVSTAEARTIIDMIGNVQIKDVNDRAKRQVLVELFNVVHTEPTSVMLVGVRPNSPVDVVKLIRALTGCGLKEAKDLLDLFDPKREGGTIGPVPLPSTYDAAMHRLAINERDYSWKNYITIQPV